MQDKGTSVVELIIMVVVGVWAYNTWFKPADWTAVFYPNANDLTQSRQQGGLSSIDECRDWVDAQAKNNFRQYDYECGKNCKTEQYTVLICETTEQ